MRTPVAAHRTGTWGQVKTHYLEAALAVGLVMVIAVAGIALLARDDGNDGGGRIGGVVASTYAREEAIAAGLGTIPGGSGTGLDDAFKRKTDRLDAAEFGVALGAPDAVRIEAFNRKLERLEAEGEFGVFAPSLSDAYIGEHDRLIDAALGSIGTGTEAKVESGVVTAISRKLERMEAEGESVSSSEGGPAWFLRKLERMEQ